MVWKNPWMGFMMDMIWRDVLAQILILIFKFFVQVDID